MKRPSFQFYPGDWLRDTALRSCSVGARGLWMEMICLMHEGSPYGHLQTGYKPITVENLARMAGASIPNVSEWLAELTAGGVCSATPQGVIYSRRMVRDEGLREIRSKAGKMGAEYGKLGGRPKITANNGKVNGKITPKTLNDEGQNNPPASASASASALNNTEAGPQRRFTDAWGMAYKEVFGQPYAFDGGRDGKAASELLKLEGTTPDSLMTIARAAWAQKDGGDQKFFYCKHSITIHGFRKQFNSIRNEIGQLISEPPKKDWGMSDPFNAQPQQP